MATHYLATTGSVTQELYGIYGSWKNVTHKIKVDLTITAAGAVSFTITSSHSSGGNLSLWVEINGKEIVPTGYYGWFQDSNGKDYFKGPKISSSYTTSTKFPYNQNSTCTGSAGTVSGGSVSVKIKLIKGSSYSGWPDAWTASLKSGSVSRSYWTDIAAPSQSSISDTYANSYSITGYTSKAGTNNAINKTTLYYKVGSGSYTAVANNALTYSGSFTPSGTANTIAVSAYTTVDGVRNDPSSTAKTVNIRQYKAPNKPKNLTIASSSYKNGRLTIKQDWTFTWTASTPGTGTGTTNGTDSNQTTSKVKGYKITIQKKTGSGNFTNIAIKNSSGTTITDSSHNYYANVTSLTFSPLKSNILPGDQVKIIVKPYTQYGRNNDGDYLYGTEASYTTITVQNAGVMRVKAKTGGTASNPVYNWREGVVWVKVNKGTAAKPNVQWVEADIVKTKVGTLWRESQ